MSNSMTTLHEICVKMAKKQAGMADSLTEDAPILKVCRWIPSSHGLWNVAEKVEDVKSAAFVEPDAPLPVMSVTSDLVHTDLHVMGGVMEVPTQRALKFGGAARYFADRQDFILRKAGMDTEKVLMERNWLKGALAAKNVLDAGAAGKGWHMLAVRFDSLNNVGLYDPQQFKQDRLFNIETPYGGKEQILHTPGFEGVYGFSVIYRANFGWQCLDPKRTCAAIVNIDENNPPTPDMIDDILAKVRAQPGSTYLFMGPYAKIHGVNPHKLDHVQIANADASVNTLVESWGGIPIIVSHNFANKGNKINVPA